MATTDEKKFCCEWVSILLRIAMVVLFGTAAVAKWINGAGASAESIQQMFAGTSFPHWIVLLYSWGIPYIEATIAAWFLLGFGLRTAWFVLGLYMMSLGFGANVAQKWVLGGLNYLFVLFAAAGIWFSGPDDWKFGLKFKKKRRRR